ncbi:MAG TPA: YqaA family protein [Thermohalobaculum sp.]|nr:YqaA family protein [Thermohalobaculum sp.]
MRMLRRLYDHVFLLAQRPNAMWALAIISFAESSFFPITPLVMLIPMVLARPDRAWVIAGVCTVASVAGGVAGWGIGYAFYEEIGRPVMEFYGKADAFEELAARFREFGAEAVVVAAVTPIPYKVVTIASGAVNLSLAVLIGASIVGRSIQFFMVAALLWKFGAPAKVFIEKRLGMITTVVVLVIVGGFVVAKYLL